VLNQIDAEKMRVLLFEYNMYKKTGDKLKRFLSKDIHEWIVSLMKEAPEKSYFIEKDEHVEEVLTC
jgi:hypothetical protein